MTQEELKEIQEIVKGKAWESVELILEKYLDELCDIRSVDTTLPTDTLARQVHAKQEASETLRKFLNEIGVLKADKRERPRRYR